MYLLKSMAGLVVLLISTITVLPVKGQDKRNRSNLIYVDKQGVIRFTKTNKEAAFFGVNYTIPFAYGYRSVKRTGISIEKAIDDDVYHMARLGLDAFRVHVWDTEISDSSGNLLENDHLRLFDYLLAKLKERGIKILVTPIAFWGNGYPEKDEKTGSFSNVYGKGPSVVNESAFKAQENYLRQFFKHVNPYTNLTYTNDPDVIAMEINNEPHHSGPKVRATEYVNRMAAAVRSTGWTKPVFYNISESPTYADAVAKANVDGHSFQWYPTGLVANRTLNGNFLTHVDKYHIPFDTIPAFRNRAKMVYEFDAGDVLQSNMYPAMARSFRSAGFQWATQFAYDPMATAYANTEYQTHYLNLAYTPSKAISFMIASKVFHQLGRNKAYGTYPADSVFDVFRTSYKEPLSEMNAPETFYYSNSTSTEPVNIQKLQHIAGVGSSPVIKYAGYGAYFIDKIADGVWRLEVMPDAIHIRDPFEKASPRKEVTRIQWENHQMTVILPDLGSDFTVSGLNNGNNFSTTSDEKTFKVTPGTYLLKSKATSSFDLNRAGTIGSIRLNEFVAPKPFSTDVFVSHQPYQEICASTPFIIAAKIVGIDENDRVSGEVQNSSAGWKTIELKRSDRYSFSADVPVEMVTPGLINYRIIIQRKNNVFIVFPGSHHGDPYAWDQYENETWQTFVATANSPLVLFNANNDRKRLEIYNPWRSNFIQYVTAEKPGQLVFKMTLKTTVEGQSVGGQLFISDKLKERQSEIALMDKMVVRARSANVEPVRMKVAMLTKEGAGFASEIEVTNAFQNIHIPFSSFKPDSTLLLPRPYPGFQPLKFYANAESLNLNNIEKIQVLFGESQTSDNKASKSIEVESIYLDKSK